MSRLSLRLRLALAGFAAIAAALALAWFGLVWLFERNAYRALADDLEGYVLQIIGGLEFDAQGAPLLPKPPVDPRFQTPLSGLYWQVTGPTVLRSRSLWDQTLTLPRDDPRAGDTHVHEIAGPGGRVLLASERRIQRPDGTGVRVVVASDLTRLRAARDAFAADLAPSLMLLGVALAAAAWLQLTIGLRPLLRLRREAAAIASGDRARLSNDAPAEVLPLVRELNALLDHRDAEMERARGRAADLAHGLKTPLAAIAGEARRLREEGRSDVADSIDASGETMRRHVERELARARAGSAGRLRGAPAAPVFDVVESLFRILRRTDRGERLTLVNDAPRRASAPFERGDLTEALGNILDNAVRYAGATVKVSCEGDPRATAITVEDDGPGLEPGGETTVRRRGGRLDESGGAGLGLALTQDILEAYRWRMDFSRSSLGGLKVRLSAIPAASGEDDASRSVSRRSASRG